MSAPWSSPWLDAELPTGWSVRPRTVDLGRGRLRALAGRLSDTARTLTAARRYDVLMVSTSSTDLMLVCVAHFLLGRRRLIAYDPLQPDNGLLRRLLLRRLARRIDLVMCVRRSDLVQWRSSRRQEFVPFLAPAASLELAASTRPVSIYSGGAAHRDFQLLVDAVGGLDVDTIISTDVAVDAPNDSRVDIRPHVAPEAGRALQRSAGITAVLLKPTTRPAGPLVLLDAMAAGAAIVCTRSPGLVDYVEDGVDAIVLQHPARPAELREQLLRLIGDPTLRESLGGAARRKITTELSSASTMATCERLIGDSGGGPDDGSRRSPGR